MHYIALPLLNESHNIPSLLTCLKQQEYKDFVLIVCVNNYDDWWGKEDKRLQCEDNQKSIELLEAEIELDIIIIDKSSKGKAWPPKKGGVGRARKTAMDHIALKGRNEDIIVSIDADTYYPPNYLAEIELNLKDKKYIGLALPYYHKTTGENDKLILRYEIYMRYFLLNLMRINNPFAYTALGSAMAFPLWAYKKVGGLTPVMSGEDFYFLQKLSKSGQLAVWADTIAYPSSRFSDRVNFGTGPALIKGHTGDWDSYPIYDHHHFDLVKTTYNMFPSLYVNDESTPMNKFLEKQFATSNLWAPLRNNYKDEANFIKACINKVDGLRILQFLKSKNPEIHNSSRYLIDYLLEYSIIGKEDEIYKVLNDFSFDQSSVNEMKVIRDYLFQKEMGVRRIKEFLKK